ncbi:glycosyltransferase family 2 protein [Bacteroides fragilis]|nr:glycosyltransferase family 2 protein [Bacteroides fragilis]MCS2741327.1 glycosyltransferase family 2 protein [Bacteroides fragilis]MCS2920946.1 glycosyltransferase family 2 protein [Bacteroides fragilis]
MANYFDGIILLDDESTDRTWDLAIHDKIILKVKKKRSGFNDLENRNILLDLSAFFQSEWFCFMDIDERFDERFTNFSEFENNKEIHVVSFRGVYLWNDEQSYKGDIPNSNKGILTVYRMFRPIGHTHINTHKKLHFIATPYFTNTWQSNILFKDYGSMKENDRIRKYERYIQEDQQKDMSSGYDYLLNSENLYQLDKIEEY